MRPAHTSNANHFPSLHRRLADGLTRCSRRTDGFGSFCSSQPDEGDDVHTLVDEGDEVVAGFAAQLGPAAVAAAVVEAGGVDIGAFAQSTRSQVAVGAEYAGFQICLVLLSPSSG